MFKNSLFNFCYNVNSQLQVLEGLDLPDGRDDLRQVLLNRCNPSLMETLLIQKMARAAGQVFQCFTSLGIVYNSRNILPFSE